MTEILTVINERVDDIPLLLAHLDRMDVPRLLEEHFLVTVQVVKTEITPQLASADGLRGAETAPLPYGELLHTRR